MESVKYKYYKINWFIIKTDGETFWEKNIYSHNTNWYISKIQGLKQIEYFVDCEELNEIDAILYNLDLE